MAKYQILYWHDIPIQVRVRGKDGRVSKELPPRFQIAIDNAAMEAELTESDLYTELFNWHPRVEREGSAEAVAAAVLDELIAEYPKVDWRKTAAELKAKYP